MAYLVEGHGPVDAQLGFDPISVGVSLVSGLFNRGTSSDEKKAAVQRDFQAAIAGDLSAARTILNAQHENHTQETRGYYRIAEAELRSKYPQIVAAAEGRAPLPTPQPTTPQVPVYMPPYVPPTAPYLPPPATVPVYRPPAPQAPAQAQPAPRGTGVAQASMFGSLPPWLIPVGAVIGVGFALADKSGGRGRRR